MKFNVNPSVFIFRYTSAEMLFHSSITTSFNIFVEVIVRRRILRSIKSHGYSMGCNTGNCSGESNFFFQIIETFTVRAVCFGSSSKSNYRFKFFWIDLTQVLFSVCKICYFILRLRILYITYYELIKHLRRHISPAKCKGVLNFYTYFILFFSNKKNLQP